MCIHILCIVKIKFIFEDKLLNLLNNNITDIVLKNTTSDFISAKEEQKEIIQQELVKAIGNDCNYEIISRIHEEIGELIEANAADPNPLILEKNDMLNVMSKSGAADEAISMYRDSENTDISVPAENIIDSGRLDVKTSGISIKVENSDMYRLKTMDINGRKCLVIEVDDCIEVNGIPVKG